jgi:hypothetical protein
MAAIKQGVAELRRPPVGFGKRQPMTRSVCESTVRRRAARLGYRIRASRRAPYAGLLMIVDADTNSLCAGGDSYDGLTWDEADEWLRGGSHAR